MEQSKANKAGGEKVLQEAKDAKTSLWDDMLDDTEWSVTHDLGVSGKGTSGPPRPIRQDPKTAAPKRSSRSQNPTVP